MGRLARLVTREAPAVTVARVVDAPPEAVWDLLIDTRRWPEWGPSITGVECADRRIEEGSTGRVRTIGGLWIPFEVTACERYGWTWRVAGIPATGHRVEPLTEGCRVAFEVPVLATPYVPVCRIALSRIAALAE